MTRIPFADSIKTGLLATGWYANRLERDAFPGVLTLCYHGLRQSAEDDGTRRTRTCMSAPTRSTPIAG